MNEEDLNDVEDSSNDDVVNEYFPNEIKFNSLFVNDSVDAILDQKHTDTNKTLLCEFFRSILLCS